jgi:hypothetical protein
VETNLPWSNQTSVQRTPDAHLARDRHMAADLSHERRRWTRLPSAVLKDPVKNSSRVYNYAEWNATSRKIAASQIGTDARVQPKPEELELDPQIRPLCEPGGIILFSDSQLHSSVPNTSTSTRFSIDLRTVHIDDGAAGVAAPNIDSECRGATMGDYLRCSDLEHVPDSLIAEYDISPSRTADTAV